MFISNTTPQSECLTDGVFYTCEPSDLSCLCAKEQALVDEYVINVTPCLESEERKEFCTDGALYRKWLFWRHRLIGILTNGQNTRIFWYKCARGRGRALFGKDAIATDAT
jgi:hypothetical protein